jgi:hypothetical protein
LYEAIQHRLYCGKYPAKNPAELKDSAAELGLLGIDTVVDFTEPDELTTSGEPLFRFSWHHATGTGLMQAWSLDKVRSINYVSMPVWDDHPPTKRVASKFCKFLDAEFNAGRRVYIHCRGGIGRTATMVCVYLLWAGMASRYSWRKTIDNLRCSQNRNAPMPLQVDWLNEVWVPYCEEVWASYCERPPANRPPKAKY